MRASVFCICVLVVLICAYNNAPRAGVWGLSIHHIKEMKAGCSFSVTISSTTLGHESSTLFICKKLEKTVSHENCNIETNFKMFFFFREQDIPKLNTGTGDFFCGVERQNNFMDVLHDVYFYLKKTKPNINKITIDYAGAATVRCEIVQQSSEGFLRLKDFMHFVLAIIVFFTLMQFYYSYVRRGERLLI